VQGETHIGEQKEGEPSEEAVAYQGISISLRERERERIIRGQVMNEDGKLLQRTSSVI